jgi:hypothetical protein
MKCSLFVKLVRSEEILNVLCYICSMQNAYDPKPNDDAADSGSGGGGEVDDDES